MEQNYADVLVSQTISILELFNCERMLHTRPRESNKGRQCGLSVDYTVKTAEIDC